LLEVGFYTTRKPTEHKVVQLVFWLYKNQLPAKRDAHTKNHRFAGSWFLYNQKIWVSFETVVFAVKRMDL